MSPDTAKVSCEEVFGPVCVVNPVDSLAEAYERANGTDFGLQAGIFTASISTALAAAEALEFGGVTVNEAPTFRADQMPYGGIKESGNTKEGPAFTIREMTEERLVVRARPTFPELRGRGLVIGVAIAFSRRIVCLVHTPRGRLAVGLVAFSGDPGRPARVRAGFVDMAPLETVSLAIATSRRLCNTPYHVGSTPA